MSIGQNVVYNGGYWQVVRVCRVTLVIEQTLSGMQVRTRRVKKGAVLPV